MYHSIRFMTETGNFGDGITLKQRASRGHLGVISGSSWSSVWGVSSSGVVPATMKTPCNCLLALCLYSPLLLPPRDFVFLTLRGWRGKRSILGNYLPLTLGCHPCILREGRVLAIWPRGVGGSVREGELETSQGHFSTKWTYEHPFKTHWAKLFPNIYLRKTLTTQITQITEVFMLSLKSKLLLCFFLNTL